MTGHPMFLQGTDKRLAEAKVILPVHAVREEFNFQQFLPCTQGSKQLSALSS
jgi:hypothetical protein